MLFSSDFPLDKAIRNRLTLLIGLQLFGEVLERLNRPVSKTGVGVTPPWVRIPPSPLSKTNEVSIGNRRLEIVSSEKIFNEATSNLGIYKTFTKRSLVESCDPVLSRSERVDLLRCENAIGIDVQ